MKPARLLCLLLSAPVLGGCIALQHLPSNTQLGCDTALSGHWTRPDNGAGNTPFIISDTCELHTDSHAIYYLIAQVESAATGAEIKTNLQPSTPVQLRFATFQHQGQGYLRFDSPSFHQLLNAATLATKEQLPLSQDDAQQLLIQDTNAHLLLRYRIEDGILKITPFYSSLIYGQIMQTYGASALPEEDPDPFLIRLSPQQLDTFLPTIEPALRIPHGPEVPPLQLQRSPSTHTSP